MRRPLVLTLLFAALATALFFLWKSVEEVTAPMTASTTTEDVQRAPSPEALVADDAPASLEAASESSRSTAEVTAASASADPNRTETFSLDDVRWIEGRVSFPPGTPADEEVEIWAIQQPMTPAAGFRVNPNDSHSLVDAAQSNESNEWSVRRVEADGSFKVPFPTGAVAQFALVGRYVYAPPRVAPADATTPLEFTPELGGWLVFRCAPPAGLESELVGASAALSGFKLDARSLRSGRGGLDRKGRVAADFTFEERGVPTELRLTVVVSPKTLAIASHADFEVEAGRRTVIDLPIERGARVRGHVKDDSGEPVADATIESTERRMNFSRGFGSSQRLTTSNADGSFELPGLRAGKTKLTAQRDGYVNGESADVELANGDVRDGIDIVMSRGNRIAGRVTWPDAKPASGATVSARGTAEPAANGGGRRMRPPRRSMGETRSTKANENGEFTLSGLGDGPFDVQAGLHEPGVPNPLLAGEPTITSKGTLWTATLHDVAAGASGLSFVLQEPKGFKGRVVDDADAPVKSFHVTAMPSFDDDAPIVDRGAQAQQYESEDGTFLLEGVQDGKYRVSIQADGYVQTGDDPTVVIPQSEAELVVRVVRAGSAAGRVVDPSGRGVAGATVRAGNPGANAPFDMFDQEFTSDSGTDGVFTITQIPAGKLELTATAEGWAKSAPLSVDIAPRQTTGDLVITLRSGGKLTGEVYNSAGAPSAGRSIQMFSMDAGDMRSLMADDAGRFEADHLTPGTYQLVAEPGAKEREELERKLGDEDANRADLMSQMKMASATIVEGETTHVVLGAPPKAPVKLSGTITRAGEPAGRRNVMAIGEGGSMLESFKIGKVDANGRYEMTLDKPGNVMLVVSENPDPGRGIEFYETIPEVAEYTLDLALPLGGIRGRVRGPDGRPLADVNVQLSSDSGLTSISVMSAGGGASATSDENGRFEFTDLHPGTFAVAAGGSMGRRFMSEDSAHGRCVRGGLRVEADKVLDGVELELSKPGQITGRVVDANGEPVASATVYVRDAQGELLHRFSACATDATGRYTYEGVAPGKYTLCARTTTLAAPDSKPVSVHEGQASEVDLALEPGTWVRISTEGADQKLLRAAISIKNDRDQEVSQMIAFDALQAMFTEGISSTEKRVGPLPPGKYLVSATTKDGKTTKKSITLKGQDERKVVLRLD